MAPFLKPLRELALLVLLLPGLLLGSSAHLRICLHDWLGFEDACGLQGPESVAANCCAPASDTPVLVSQPDCMACCFDLATGSQVLASVPQLQLEQVVFAPVLAGPLEVARQIDPGQRLRPNPCATAVPAGPGRAPLPLRI